MKILVIGGTPFVGRHIVAEALARGHDVTLFNRGQTDPDAFPDAPDITGDRNGDLCELNDGEWDATIDVCALRPPRRSRTLLRTLGKRAGHYTFISTISVYGEDLPDSGFTEDAPLLEPAWDDTLDMEKYGELKVACEQVAPRVRRRPAPDHPAGLRRRARTTTTNGSPTGCARSPPASRIIGPDANQPLQCIDGRDLAAFTVGCVERGVVDTFNVTAPHEASDVPQGVGPDRLGLSRELPDVTWTRPGTSCRCPNRRTGGRAMRADLSRAHGHGLWYRPLHESARDTLVWVRAARDAGRYTPRQEYGFGSEQERSLILAADQ